MIDELRTERLLLRPLTIDHVDDYHRVYGDPRTWVHLPSGRHTSRGESARAIERSMLSHRAHGFGHCAVMLREPVDGLPAGAFLGSAGAAMLGFDAWNLGYRLAPEAWGHGFATEAATVALAAARDARPETPVTARVLANNTSSVRVLERLGLELAWSGASSAAPSGPDDTTHLERLVFADRPLDDATLDAVIALG
ncbi:GNAT family N-acetyltransferase [Agromyces ramosus]|uniref:Ribosomal-protein-alanine N-acetyltransferase n=1 Tax=Agromyces ramosus TaxID=33879 RepID=A0ABU0R480_9MICO|nr:GNAT family N-acetyltransferase [Agromyces ramosus]MDQ0892874.1 ribosomal-protein-alanine N-acetyltransferase [Agromyces ramosus]